MSDRRKSKQGKARRRWIGAKTDRQAEKQPREDNQTQSRKKTMQLLDRGMHFEMYVCRGMMERGR